MSVTVWRLSPLRLLSGLLVWTRRPPSLCFFLLGAFTMETASAGGLRLCPPSTTLSLRAASQAAVPIFIGVFFIHDLIPRSLFSLQRGVFPHTWGPGCRLSLC